MTDRVEEAKNRVALLIYNLWPAMSERSKKFAQAIESLIRAIAEAKVSKPEPTGTPCNVCGKCPCYEHERVTVTGEGKAPNPLPDVLPAHGKKVESPAVTAGTHAWRKTHENVWRCQRCDRVWGFTQSHPLPTDACAGQSPAPTPVEKARGGTAPTSDYLRGHGDGVRAGLAHAELNRTTAPDAKADGTLREQYEERRGGEESPGVRKSHDAVPRRPNQGTAQDPTSQPAPGAVVSTEVVEPPASVPAKEEQWWRTGKKLGRTLYRDDQCIGIVDTPEIAAAIVEAMNGRDFERRRGKT